MGRKKKDISYFDTTQPFSVRVNKDVMAKFLNAFHNERAFYKAAGKSFFLKGLVEDMMRNYADSSTVTGAGAEAVKNIGEVKKNLTELQDELREQYKKILAIQEKLSPKKEEE